jgi:hypothetical protein
MKIINHDVNGLQLSQRHDDGYLNLSQMAKANGKLIADYLRLDTTKAFLDKLSMVMGIPISKIEPTEQSSAKPTMNNITAANFIDSIPVVTKEATVRFTVDLPESMHRDLSILAAKRGVSKADLVRMLLNDALENINK